MVRSIELWRVGSHEMHGVAWSGTVLAYNERNEHGLDMEP